MFEAAHSERVAAEPADVWELWADPGRWPDWDERVERVESDDDLEVGAELRVKLRRGGTVRYLVTELQPERLLAAEARFPGARLGAEHRLRPGRSSVEVGHRIYLTGPLAGFWSLMMSRRRMRAAVVRFAARERELAEPVARSRGRR